MNKIWCFNILVFFTMMISCQQSTLLNSRYVGFWASTEFSYDFDENNEFTFETIGHYGNTLTTGKYVVIDSIVLLHPYTDWQEFDGVLKTRLILRNNMKYLQDFDDNFYCSDTADINKMVFHQEESRSKIIERLYELEEVELFVSSHTEADKLNNRKPYFSYDGIVLIDNEHYHRFNLRNYNMDSDKLYRSYNYFKQNYLVNVDRNQIYQHLSAGNEIVPVEPLYDK